jgi:predicted enzyme related to lactoylglutathione lyase
MTDVRTYPMGVPCWIDLAQPDLDAAQRFYGSLFGWTFADAVPPGAPGSYLIASLAGKDAAALAPGDGADGWMSYIACDDADVTANIAAQAGGSILSPPEEAGPGGRTATIADPQGAIFRLWQARRRPGAQVVNEPGAWNFSDLHTPDPAAALRFYSEVFGWNVDAHLGAGMIRLPGYGAHLAATVDPDIFERQAFAPEGFADVVAGLTASEGDARWEIRFAVADRDATAAEAERLGAEIASSTETDWTREAVVVDPQGARFVVSQLVVPD